MRKLIVLCAFFLIAVFGYSIDMENITDGNMDLQVNRIKEEFFPLYIDELKGIGYLPMKEFLYTIELNEIEVDFQNKMIKGILPDKRKIQWKFDSDISFIDNEELYLEIEQLNKIFPVKNVKFDLAMLNINIQFDFKIPADIRYEQEQKRRGMSKGDKTGKKHEYIDNKSFFSPGVIQVEYEKNDLEKSRGSSLSVNYSTQLLYGELDGEFSIFDDSRKNRKKFEVESLSLNYEDVMDKKDVILGSFYMRVPSFYDVETDINGISILDSSSRYDVTEKNGNTFEGYAPSGSVVELYRNGILIDYQNADNQRYIFRDINTQSLTDKYYIRIYKDDGTYIQQDISLWLNNKTLNKNQWSYNIQSGKVDKKGDNDFWGTLRYGVNDFVTVEAGYYDLKGKSEERYRYKERAYGIYLSSPPIKFPFWANINWYEDTEKNDGTLIWEYKQNFYDFILEGKGEKYSKRISLEENKEEKYRANIRKSFGRLNVGAGYEVEVSKGKYYRDYIASVGYNRRYVSNNIEYRFQEYEEDENRNKHSTRFQTGISYFDNWNITAEIDIKYNNKWEMDTDKYSVKFIRRNNNYYSKKYFDLSLGFTYSEKDEDHFRTEVYATIYLEDFGLPFFNTEVSFEANDRRSEDRKVGTKIKKIIVLEDLQRNSKLKNISNSWISGKVYIDNNSNSIYDEGDEPLSEIKVTVLGKSVETDEDGNYLVEDISSNSEFNVKVDRTYIDPLLYYNEEKYYKMMPSTGMHIDIPFQNTISLSGNIKLEGADIPEDKLPYIYNKMRITIKKDGKEIKTLKPEFDGFFILDGLIEGEYVMELSSKDEQYKPLKDKMELSIKPEEAANGVFEVGDLIFIKEDQNENI